MNERIAVIGLGYVGLPVALAIAKHFPGTIGFDINERRVQSLQRRVDESGELTEEELSAPLEVTSDTAALSDCTFFIVAVPTPIDENHVPDLRPVLSASETVAKAMKPGAVIVYESTVYPGVTENLCGPLLARVSGLDRKDFKLGYSPERINPGDREHTFERIVKVVSGEDAETLERVAGVYGRVVDAGIYRAPSIKVAEAAKAIENTQRDLNIALMNELALIFDRIGIRTKDVLDAASTKWNFLRFEPGLVGGHCIGVDPYYLTTLAETVGYHSEVILAGRRINEGMGSFIARSLVKKLAQADVPIRSARIGVLGFTFKPDVTDVRNTKIIDIVKELREFGIDAMIHDPLVSPEEVAHEYDVRLSPWSELTELDALIFAVPHKTLLAKPQAELLSVIRSGGLLMDVKSALDPQQIPDTIRYWSL